MTGGPVETAARLEQARRSSSTVTVSPPASWSMPRFALAHLVVDHEARLDALADRLRHLEARDQARAGAGRQAIDGAPTYG